MDRIVTGMLSIVCLTVAAIYLPPFEGKEWLGLLAYGFGAILLHTLLLLWL